MTGRKCGTCRYFEHAPIWRKGWCRNPLLYSPQQSHLVSEDDLDCERGMGNYWEPAPDIDHDGPEVQGPVDGLSTGNQPSASSAAPMHTASGQPVFPVSGSSGYGNEPPPPGQPPEDRGPRWGPEDRGDFGYYQEERYWTDYLRIAAPVLGVILMVILLWFWISNLLDDNGNGDETAGADDTTPTLSVIEEATATEEVPGTNGEESTPPGEATLPGEDEPTPGPGGQETPPAEATEPPAENGTAGGITTGSTAEVGNTGGTGLNMRADATTNAEVVTVLQDGAVVTVTGESIESEGFIWWPVEAEDGTTGYVVEEYLIPLE